MKNQKRKKKYNALGLELDGNSLKDLFASS